MLLRKFYYLGKSFHTLNYSAEKLRKFQFRLLKELIKYTYKNFRFYREKWDSEGFNPERFTKLEDLKKIPIVNKDEFRASINDIRNESKKKLGGSLLTSGSSRTERMRIEFDDRAWDWMEIIYLRPFLLRGYNPLKPMSFYFCQEHVNNWHKIFIRKRVIQKDLSLDRQLELLEKYDSPCIVYFPMVLFTLAKKLLQSEKKYSIHPKMILTRGEIITPNMRSTIEKAFGAKVYDHYGSSEFDRIAWECPQGGYHISEDSVYIEILDKSGNPVEYEETGQLIGTNMFNLYTPTIRYNQGDLVVPIEKDCDCKTIFSKIKEVKGRENDAINLGKGKIVTPYTIIDRLAKYENLLIFQLIQEGVDEFLLRYVPNRYFRKKDLDKVKKELKELGICPLEFQQVEEIKRTPGGKIPAVKNLINR